MLTSLLPTTSASRYCARWQQADERRAAYVQELAGLSLAQADFTQLLQKEIDAGMPLPRAMRRLRNLLLNSLIERDLTGRADLAEVVQAISDFADFAIRHHLSALHTEMVAMYGSPIGEESGQPQEMMGIGMGKLGAHELNVSSDIDLIFIYAEDGDTQPQHSGQKSLSNQEFFTRLGKKLIGAIAEITEDGFCFRVDMALRPNGQSGPLVASLAMLEEYLIVQGREWERYAWVKARAITGTTEDITALNAIVRPFVYRRYLDFGVIDSLRNMHAQIRAEVSRQERLHPDRSNNVKLGRGGIREIEFLAQVFQLIRGGREANLRQRGTRVTLDVLAEKELLTHDVVQALLSSYAFLRNLEHRLQYLDDAQTHTLPANNEDLLRVAQMMGWPDVASLLAALEQHRQFVASQFDAIFSDKTQDSQPLHENEPDQALTGKDDHLEAIEVRMRTLGYSEVEQCARRLLAAWQSPRLQSMPEASRNRLQALLNTALPMIAQTSTGKQNNSMSAVLGRVLDFFETIARRSAYLSLLTEYPHTLKRVIQMVSASHWAAQFLNRHPIVLDEMLDDRIRLAHTDWAELGSELKQQLKQASDDTERQLDILREVHHAQQFRLLAQDLAGELAVEELADHLSALADTIVAATLQAAWQMLPNRHREVPQFAVIAYGRLGGKELGYVSDLDVIFLFDDDDDAAAMHYAKLAQRFISWMTTHTAAGILFDIDTALRPDGASGMLVSSLSAFERYQHQSAWVWEHQALSRARFCAGDARIGERFEQIRRDVLCKPRDAQLKTEVLAMRKKMRDAYANKAGGLFDLKQDAGGMIDLEFIVQYLVLKHAAQYPQLCANKGNIALLKKLANLGLIDSTAAQLAGDAYRKMRRLQHQIRLQGEDKAKIALEEILAEVKAVEDLWQAVFEIEP